MTALRIAQGVTGAHRRPGRTGAAGLALASVLMLVVTGCGPEPNEPSPLPTPTDDGTAISPRATPGDPTTPESTPMPTATTPKPSEPAFPDPGGVGEPWDGQIGYGTNTFACERDDEVDIAGTPGDDVLRGTPTDERICGFGGNDVIYGGGGEDEIFGGAGDDKIIGSPMGNPAKGERLIGNSGDDILLGMNSGPSQDFYHGRTGNDVMIGGAAAFLDRMYGDQGDDILVPAPLSSGNDVDAGPGNDVVMTLNFSTLPRADVVDLDGKSELSIGGACKVVLPMGEGDNESRGKVSCGIPWPKRFSGMDNVLPITGTVDDEGKVSMSTSLAGRVGSIGNSDLRKMATWQANLPGDVCICDPLMSPPPTDSRIPHDAPL